MKLSDIQAMQDAGLITEDQRRAIVAHFELDRESNKLLGILSVIGAVLVSAGIILLIAVVALQAAWVIATVARQETSLGRGTVVLLETMPVSARSPARRLPHPQLQDHRVAGHAVR